MKKMTAILIASISMLNTFQILKTNADYDLNLYNVQLPIAHGNTEEISTELLNGYTTNSENDIIYITLEDFLKLSEVEIVRKSNTNVKLRRNTVWLELNINDSNATLSLGYSEDNINSSFDVTVPTLQYKDNIYICCTRF